jgi:DNA polymerase elongation subunit (family B)
MTDEELMEYDLTLLSDEQVIQLCEVYEKKADQEYYQLGLDYNLKDTLLIQRFEDETAMLSLTLTVAYSGGVNYSDAFGTVGIWESTLYRKLMSKKLVPNIKMGAAEITNELVGGYVKEPIPNMYKWVVSFDLNSLYPHLFLQYNMSPETYIRDHKIRIPDGHKDLQEMVLTGQYQNEDSRYSVCANGACFRNDVLGIIPEIIDEYYSNRKVIKNDMLDVEKDIELIKEEMKKRNLL